MRAHARAAGAARTRSTCTVTPKNLVPRRSFSSWARVPTRVTLPVSFRSGIGLHAHGHVLVALDLVDVRLAHLRLHHHLRDVGQDEQRLVGPDLVAHLRLALLGAEEDVAVDHDAGHVGPHLGARELLLGQGQLAGRLLDAALRGRDGRALLLEAVGRRRDSSWRRLSLVSSASERACDSSSGRPKFVERVAPAPGQGEVLAGARHRLLARAPAPAW